MSNCDLINQRQVTSNARQATPFLASATDATKQQQRTQSKGDYQQPAQLQQQLINEGEQNAGKHNQRKTDRNCGSSI